MVAHVYNLYSLTIEYLFSYYFYFILCKLQYTGGPHASDFYQVLMWASGSKGSNKAFFFFFFFFFFGVRWPHPISNDALYRRTQSSPISAAIRAARWSLFGHVLRLPYTPQSSSQSMPTWKTPAPPSSEDAPVVRCRRH